jgi:uncharacterized repeat protein (TIGR01451 family)
MPADTRDTSRREALKAVVRTAAYVAPAVLMVSRPASAQLVSPVATGLVLTNIVNFPNPTQGQGLNFAINVVNLGPSVATNVVISVPLPPGLPFSGDGVAGGNFAYPTWTFPTLAVGGGGSLTLVAIANASGTLVATMTATSPNPNPGNNTASATVTVQLTA